MADPSPYGRQGTEASTSGKPDEDFSHFYDFEENYSAVKDKPLKIQHVFIRGLGRTKDYIVARELQPVTECQTLEEIKDFMLEAHDNLESLGIFDAVEIIIGDGDSVGAPMCACSASNE